eukprot:3084154-Amphidinium_carterae.2
MEGVQHSECCMHCWSVQEYLPKHLHFASTWDSRLSLYSVPRPLPLLVLSCQQLALWIFETLQAGLFLALSPCQRLVARSDLTTVRRRLFFDWLHGRSRGHDTKCGLDLTDGKDVFCMPLAAL